MHRFLYNALLLAAAGPARWWLRRHPRHRALVARFAPPVPALPSRPLWVQACSVGEVNTVRPLIDALRAHWPDRPILVTASTASGHARACELFGEAMVAWFPFDTRAAVRHFLDAARPGVLVLVETELWPNVLGACVRRGVPVVVVNGRLSDKHLARYERFRWWFRPMVRGLAAAGMQSAQHAERMRALGAREEAVRVTGNLKFDAVRDQVPLRVRQRLRAEHGFKAEGRLLVFGSTRPGDEALASACWSILREEYPDLNLIVAPRHVERADEITALFSEPVARRSEVRRSREPRRERVLLLDTMGELADFLSIASVAVIGGSFYPGVNGHNPLEPAALGVPVVFGPYMANFEEAAAVLAARGGARQVACPEDLYLALSTLFGDAATRRRMGTLARKAVLEHQGAVRHTIALIEEVLAARGPAGA